jgi:tetratricopeptide (TPR) repeat protein
VKDFKKSLNLFRECLSRDEEHLNAALHLATLLGNAGESMKAAKYFKHALKIDPENVHAHFGIAKSLASSSENKEVPIKHFNIVL